MYVDLNEKWSQLFKKYIKKHLYIFKYYVCTYHENTKITNLQNNKNDSH